MAGLVFLFYFSAAFVVKEIKVAGAEGSLADTVVELARIPEGRPLARVSESRVRERVMEDPRIGSMAVEREWPSTVTFRVGVREPALVLRHGKDRWLTDATGVVFGTARKAPEKVPSVTVPEAPEQLTHETVQGLLELFATKPPTRELEGRMSTPVMAADGSVTMKVEELTIRWGQPGDSQKKWAVVTALIGQEAIDPEGGVPQTIDVSIPDQPVVSGLPPTAP